MRRLVRLTAKDIRVVVRNHYLTVAVVIALLLAGAVNFLIPERVASGPAIVVWDATSEQVFATFYRAAGDGRTLVAASEAAFAEALETSTTRIGLRVEPGDPLRLVVVYQGSEPARLRRVVEATFRAQAAALVGAGSSQGGAGPDPGSVEGSAPGPVFASETLRPAVDPAARPPLGESLLPVLVFSEVVFLGLFLAAALLYAEAEEGTLKAYLVTPGRLPEYLLAKTAAMAFLALVYTIVLSGLTVGLGIDWLSVLGVTVLSAVTMTLLAMVVANFFRTLNEFLFAGVVMNALLSLPLVAYFAPGVAPGWFRVLPSFPLLFALREGFFPTGDGAVLAGAVSQTLATLVAALPMAVWSFKWRLARREG